MQGIPPQPPQRQVSLHMPTDEFRKSSSSLKSQFTVHRKPVELCSSSSSESCQNVTQLLNDSSRLMKGGLPFDTILTGTLKRNQSLNLLFESSISTAEQERYGVQTEEVVKSTKQKDIDYLRQDNSILSPDFIQLVKEITVTQAGQNDVQVHDWQALHQGLSQCNQQLSHLNSLYRKEEKYRAASLQMLQLYTAAVDSVQPSSKQNYVSSRQKHQRNGTTAASSLLTNGSSSSVSQRSITPTLGSTESNAIRAATEAYFESTSKLHDISAQMIELFQRRQSLDNSIWMPINQNSVQAFVELKQRLELRQIEYSRMKSIVFPKKVDENLKSRSLNSQDLLTDERVRILCQAMMKRTNV